LATLALVHVTHFGVFSVIGGMLVVCLAAFWVTVAAHTVHNAWRGDLFVAPCLRDKKFLAGFESDAA
jgi:hypothetical protein